MNGHTDVVVATLTTLPVLIGLILVVVAVAFLLARARKTAAILSDIESLPPEKRLYKLEREYRLHPGPKQASIATMPTPASRRADEYCIFRLVKMLAILHLERAL